MIKANRSSRDDANSKCLKHRALTAALSATLALSACSQIAAQGTASATLPVAFEPLGEPVGLAINGFNYTDLPISFFSVAYQGGGNILPSTPTSGGGGTVCCVRWRPGTTLPKPMLVEWSRYTNQRWRTCQKTVMLNGPVPANPTAIGVHFMPDGDVQLEITAGYPKLKLKLNIFDDGHRHEFGNEVHDEKTASCKDGR